MIGCIRRVKKAASINPQSVQLIEVSKGQELRLQTGNLLVKVKITISIYWKISYKGNVFHG